MSICLATVLSDESGLQNTVVAAGRLTYYIFHEKTAKLEASYLMYVMRGMPHQKQGRDQSLLENVTFFFLLNMPPPKNANLYIFSVQNLLYSVYTDSYIAQK